MYYRNNTKFSQGTSLIEVILYIGLFSILITGSIISAVAIIESNNRTQTESMMIEEGNFLLFKIGYELKTGGIVTIPSIHSENNFLTLTSASSSVLSPITFKVINKNLTIKRGTQSSVILNNSSVEISSSTFLYTSSPKSLQYQFTASARTPDGHTIEEIFKDVFYFKND